MGGCWWVVPAKQLTDLDQLVRFADPFHLEHGAFGHSKLTAFDPLDDLTQVRTNQLMLLG